MKWEATVSLWKLLLLHIVWELREVEGVVVEVPDFGKVMGVALEVEELLVQVNCRLVVQLPEQRELQIYREARHLVEHQGQHSNMCLEIYISSDLENGGLGLR